MQGLKRSSSTKLSPRNLLLVPPRPERELCNNAVVLDDNVSGSPRGFPGFPLTLSYPDSPPGTLPCPCLCRCTLALGYLGFAVAIVAAVAALIWERICSLFGEVADVKWSVLALVYILLGVSTYCPIDGLFLAHLVVAIQPQSVP